MEYALNDEISVEREKGRKMKRKRILSHKKKLARETEKDVQPKALKVRRNL
ncbi:unnamed protein product [Brassica oleracea]